MNIKRYINQREFASFNVNLSLANKCTVKLYSHGKMKLNCMDTCKNKAKLMREQKCLLII